MMTLKVKRVYDKAEKADGYRVLVDRLWPRGLKKEEARVDLWYKDIAPSDALRQWFGHEPQKWAMFRVRYFEELDYRPDSVEGLWDAIRDKKTVTLLFGAKEERYNNAAALKEFLGKWAGRKEAAALPV